MKRHSGLGSLGTVRREMSPHQANHSSSESINICITITGSMLAVTWHRFVCVCLVKKTKQTCMQIVLLSTQGFSDCSFSTTDSAWVFSSSIQTRDLCKNNPLCSHVNVLTIVVIEIVIVWNVSLLAMPLKHDRKQGGFKLAYFYTNHFKRQRQNII